jgi:hypothetical protein
MAAVGGVRTAHNPSARVTLEMHGFAIILNDSLLYPVDLKSCYPHLFKILKK